MRSTPVPLRDDIPSVCPGCDRLAVYSEKPRWWARYQCCRCFTEFARFPRTLGRLMPVRTGVCGCLYRGIGIGIDIERDD